MPYSSPFDGIYWRKWRVLLNHNRRSSMVTEGPKTQHFSVFSRISDQISLANCCRLIRFFLLCPVAVLSNLREEIVVTKRFLDMMAQNIGYSNSLLFHQDLILAVDFPKNPVNNKSHQRLDSDYCWYLLMKYS